MSIVGKWYGFGRNSLYDAGVRAREVHDWPLAISQFRAAHAAERDSAFRMVIGRALAGALGEAAHSCLAHDPAAALALADEALAHAPAFADLHLVRGRALRSMDRPQEARVSLLAALDINPRYAEALLHLAALDCQESLTAGAEALERVRSSGVSIDPSALEEAEARLARGDGALAAAALDAMRAHEGEEAARLAGEGDRHGRERRWLEAVEAYQQAVHEAPGFADLRCRLAQAWMEAGELEHASRELEAALAINPRYAEAWAVKGIIHRRNGDEEHAQEAFRLALQYDPSQTIAREELVRSPRA